MSSLLSCSINFPIAKKAHASNSDPLSVQLRDSKMMMYLSQTVNIRGKGKRGI